MKTIALIAAILTAVLARPLPAQPAEPDPDLMSLLEFQEWPLTHPSTRGQPKLIAIVEFEVLGVEVTHSFGPSDHRLPEQAEVRFRVTDCIIGAPSWDGQEVTTTMRSVPLAGSDISNIPEGIPKEGAAGIGYVAKIDGRVTCIPGALLGAITPIYAPGALRPGHSPPGEPDPGYRLIKGVFDFQQQLALAHTSRSDLNAALAQQTLGDNASLTMWSLWALHQGFGDAAASSLARVCSCSSHAPRVQIIADQLLLETNVGAEWRRSRERQQMLSAWLSHWLSDDPKRRNLISIGYLESTLRHLKIDGLLRPELRAQIEEGASGRPESSVERQLLKEVLGYPSPRP